MKSLEKPQANKEKIKTFAEAFDPRKNSISFLRFFLSILVLFSHSHSIGKFGLNTEFLYVWSKGEKGFGDFAVDSFFALSGFLITDSYLKNSNILRYLWKRGLRIFPGFWVCLFVTAFLIGPIVYFFDRHDLNYFFISQEGPFSYVKNNFLLKINQETIADLFSNNAQPVSAPIVNGSLWSLFKEFQCYLLVPMLGVLGLFRKNKTIFLGIFIVSFALFASRNFNLSILNFNLFFPRLLVFFLGGILYCLYKDKIPAKSTIFFVLCLINFLGFRLGYYNIIAPLTLPYILFWLASYLPFSKFEKYVGGDYSYGIYIYGYPLQQTLAWAGASQHSLWLFFIFSVTLTLPFAITSWRYVEKPCLLYKNVNLPSFRQ
jgi:peptidoglycan/LPS O-acetylase OafA/YrhL